VAVNAQLYELMRLWLIGTRMAHQTGWRFLLVNLVRSGALEEADIEERFGEHIAQNESRGFRRLTWEQVVVRVASEPSGCLEVERMVRNIADKTLGYERKYEGERVFDVLRRAFDVRDGAALDLA
jgi:hypothetical protein